MLFHFRASLWFVLTAAGIRTAAGAPDRDESLIWGTYRPGLYFGLKPRFPESLMTGLIWYGTQDFNAFTSP
jgi:mannosyl-oligosaccharide glucosidase